MDQINDIWNYSFIRQQAQQQFHRSQVIQIQDSTHKLKDFLDSLDKIDPGYRDTASMEFCAILFDYFQRHSGNS